MHQVLFLFHANALTLFMVYWRRTSGSLLTISRFSRIMLISLASTGLKCVNSLSQKGIRQRSRLKFQLGRKNPNCNLHLQKSMKYTKLTSLLFYNHREDCSRYGRIRPSQILSSYRVTLGESINDMNSRRYSFWIWWMENVISTIDWWNRFILNSNERNNMSFGMQSLLWFIYSQSFYATILVYVVMMG